MGKIKYYISGKITGLQPSEYAARFGKAEEHLTAQGFDVVNPLRHVVPSAHWKEQMKVDIRLLLDCNAIYMLSNWEQSIGATIEHDIAEGLGLIVEYERTLK